MFELLAIGPELREMILLRRSSAEIKAAAVRTMLTMHQDALQKAAAGITSLEEIVRVSVAAGGVLSGEHGIGLEKRDFMPLMFTADDLDAQARLRRSFDTTGLANPNKVLPSPASCGDVQHVPEGAWI